MPQHTFIYAIRCNEFVKIGIALWPPQRIGEMQVGNPYDLELIRQYRVSTEDAFLIEKNAHAKLSEHSKRGEWFKCSNEEAFDAIETAHKIQNSKILYKNANDDRFIWPHIKEATNKMAELFPTPRRNKATQ